MSGNIAIAFAKKVKNPNCYLKSKGGAGHTRVLLASPIFFNSLVQVIYLFFRHWFILA